MVTGYCVALLYRAACVWLLTQINNNLFLSLSRKEVTHQRVIPLLINISPLDRTQPVFNNKSCTPVREHTYIKDFSTQYLQIIENNCITLNQYYLPRFILTRFELYSITFNRCHLQHPKHVSKNKVISFTNRNTLLLCVS